MAADPITSNAVDGLLDYNLSEDDDPWGDMPISNTRDDKATLSPRAAKRKLNDDDKENFGLGLDEEVKIIKKRKPVAKLDQARLLSQPGLPKLRGLAQSGQFAKKLRLKGKGHEFTDAARLLTYYQLWLDDLYPRAKFVDALQLVEKAGHGKSMQRQRKDWIDEGKPGYLRERERRKEDGPEAIEDEAMMSGGLNVDHEKEKSETEDHVGHHTPRKSIFGNPIPAGGDDLFFPDANTSKDGNDGPDDDELDALLAEQTTRPSPPHKRAAPEPESEGEDDLDALLAQQEARRKPELSNIRSRLAGGMFEDDQDVSNVLLADQDARNATPSEEKSGKPLSSSKLTSAAVEYTPEEENEDDLDALLAEQESRHQPTASGTADDNEPELPPMPTTNVDDSQGKESNFILSSSPIANKDFDDDELDALLSEQNAETLNTPPTSVNEEELQNKELDISQLLQEPSKDDSQGKESAIIFSSSPMLNSELGMDDLDALMDAQDMAKIGL